MCKKWKVVPLSKYRIDPRSVEELQVKTDAVSEVTLRDIADKFVVHLPHAHEIEVYWTCIRTRTDVCFIPVSYASVP